ncbi:MAG: discoidin domain-containing protein, partial [Candidatus Howiella sp.]
MTQSKCLSNLRRGLHNFLCCALCAGLFLGILAPATVCAGGTAHLLTAVDAIAGNQYSDQRPTLIIDGSGLTGEGTAALHDAHANAFTMWHTDANPGANAWVQVDFGSAFALDELWIWNMNQQNNTTRGLKNIKIEYTADGIVWNTLQPEEGIAFADSPEGYPFQLAQATGQADMAATNLNDGSNTPIRFGGAKARYVKITAHPDAGVGSWGDVYFGLSEVRFTSSEETVPVSGISVSNPSGTNAISVPGGTLQMQATIQPSNATVQTVEWSVTDSAENIAIVSADGLLSARRNGTVEVVATAKDGSGVIGSCSITITGQPTVLPGVTATAGDAYENRGAEYAINGSGMGAGVGEKASLYDLHDNHGFGETMWHTNANPGANAWIQFDLGSAQTVDELWIWNMNQQNNTTRGLKNIKIEYTADGIVWNTLQPEEDITFADSPEGYPFQLAQATGQADMAATNLNDGSNTPIRFGGAKARYVKITAHPDAGVGSWGDVYFGLSEVRFTVQGSTPSVDQEAIDNVISLIDAIGEVAATAASESKIVAAETAYAAL